MRSISGMPSDDMPPKRKRGGDTLLERRKANAKHFWNAFRRYAAEAEARGRYLIEKEEGANICQL